MSLEGKEKNEPIKYIFRRKKNRTNEWNMEKEKENNITYVQLDISCWSFSKHMSTYSIFISIQ